jgi:pyruvate dehydrogenase E2 component (dihydrolipoamide acetyltransferase)
MSRDFRMPSLGADMAAGTLVEWRVQPGSRVRRGDVVALVETEKGIIDIESFEDGIVERLSVQPGTRVPVGTALATFEGEPTARPIAESLPAGEVLGIAAASTATESSAPAPAAAAQAGSASPAEAGAAALRAQRVSPAARARAAKLGIDVATLRGSGPQGTVTLQDVEHAAAHAPSPSAPAQPKIAREGMRNAIAASMSRSKREIPHYYLQLAIDLQPALRWLEEFNNSRSVPERLLSTVLLIKATARAAAEKPGFNGYFGTEGFAPSGPVHAGVAIALRGGGLVAPAIFDAQQKALPVIMRELQDLVGRVRAGHMRSSEIASATLTVTSLGEEGSDAIYPIIYPPQVAIVGFGAILERPWVGGGRIEARPVVNVTLAADHRVTDGRQGAQFLARIRDWLAQPAEL